MSAHLHHQPDPATVVDVLALALYMRPANVRLVTRYWLRSYGPLPFVPAATPTGPAGQEAFVALVRALLVPPSEVAVGGQEAALPRDETPEPEMLALFHFGLGWPLAVPEHLWREQADTSEAARQVVGALALMMDAPETYWARVSRDGMRSHLQADCFRFPERLPGAYAADLWLAHVLGGCLDLLCRELDKRGLVDATVGAGIAQTLGRHVRTALAAEPTAAAAASPIIAGMARELETCVDLALTCTRFTALRQHLDARAWAACVARNPTLPLIPV